MEEKPKVIYKVRKSTGKTVTIVILIILLLSAIGYIGYFEYQKLSDNKDSNVEKDEREELYYSEVVKILDQIDLYNEVFKSQYPINDVQKIDNQLKLNFGFLALKKDQKINNYYKVDDLKEAYYNYFKEGFSAIYEDVKCPVGDGVLYQFDNDKKTFTLDYGHKHKNITMSTDTYFSSGEIDNNKYIIKTHILYSNYCTDTCNPNGGYYSSYNSCVEGKKPITYKKSEYDSIKEKLPNTIFTFIKDKNNFRLESIKID